MLLFQYAHYLKKKINKKSKIKMKSKRFLPFMVRICFLCTIDYVLCEYFIDHRQIKNTFLKTEYLLNYITA